MELKLQQAIVATRAGRTDVAQHLLTQLLRDNPDDANAWFLMGHIVSAPDRQARYLQKAVELDPDHAIARQHLMRLGDPPVPAPVIPIQAAQESGIKLNGDDSPQRPAGATTAAVAVTAANELPEWLQDLENKQLQTNDTHEKDWPSTAAPVRETRKASAQTTSAPVPQSQPDPKPKSSSQPGEVWLVRILVIMVVVAAIILGILVLLILI